MQANNKDSRTYKGALRDVLLNHRSTRKRRCFAQELPRVGEKINRAGVSRSEQEKTQAAAAPGARAEVCGKDSQSHMGDARSVPFRLRLRTSFRCVENPFALSVKELAVLALRTITLDQLRTGAG